jgi:tRNA(adenine34) deaminase
MSSIYHDQFFMQRAIQLALEAEREGNPPVGAVIVMENRIIAEGASNLLIPNYDPKGHAEMNAMDRIDPGLWLRAREMTCYTTLEPCCMCFGRLLVSAVGRIVFGALDAKGGSGCLISHLPVFYHENNIPEFVGPIAPEQCDELYTRTALMFNNAMNKIGI